MFYSVSFRMESFSNIPKNSISLETKKDTAGQSSNHSHASTQHSLNLGNNIGLLASICAGFYIGFSSRSAREAWIYSIILFGFSLFCICYSISAPYYSKRKSISQLILYFLVSALSVPIAAFIGSNFT